MYKIYSVIEVYIENACNLATFYRYLAIYCKKTVAKSQKYNLQPFSNLAIYRKKTVASSFFKFATIFHYIIVLL